MTYPRFVLKRDELRYNPRVFLVRRGSLQPYTFNTLIHNAAGKGKKTHCKIPPFSANLEGPRAPCFREGNILKFGVIERPKTLRRKAKSTSFKECIGWCRAYIFNIRAVIHVFLQSMTHDSQLRKSSKKEELTSLIYAP